MSLDYINYILCQNFSFRKLNSLWLFLLQYEVKQGDPLSPSLFFLVGEGLKRRISKPDIEGVLYLMTDTIDVTIPYHILYVNDILIFYKVKLSNNISLNQLFTKYNQALEKVFSTTKSTIFFGSISNRRLNNIMELTIFSKGTLYFHTPKVPIFKVKVIVQIVMSVIVLSLHFSYVF